MKLHPEAKDRGLIPSVVVLPDIQWQTIIRWGSPSESDLLWYPHTTPGAG